MFLCVLVKLIDSDEIENVVVGGGDAVFKTNPPQTFSIVPHVRRNNNRTVEL